MADIQNNHILGKLFSSRIWKYNSKFLPTYKSSHWGRGSRLFMLLYDPTWCESSFFHQCLNLPPIVAFTYTPALDQNSLCLHFTVPKRDWGWTLTSRYSIYRRWLLVNSCPYLRNRLPRRTALWRMDGTIRERSWTHWSFGIVGWRLRVVRCNRVIQN